MIKLQNSLFTDILPPHLKDDGIKALAYAIGKQVAALCAYADSSRTYAALATAPDAVLDALAAELRTPAYEESLDIETKRGLVASTLMFYTRLGTPGALEELITILFAKGKITEWFDYSGDVYHFKAQIDVAADTIDDKRQAQIQAWINQYKNQRSVLDTIEYYETGSEAGAYVAAAFVGCMMTDSAIAQNYN